MKLINLVLIFMIGALSYACSGKNDVNDTKKNASKESCDSYHKYLDECSPFKCQYAHPMTGTSMEKEIVGIVENKCKTIEQMPGDMTLTCNLTKEIQKGAAKYLLEYSKSKSKSLKNPLNDAMNSDMCKISQAGDQVDGSNPENDKIEASLAGNWIVKSRSGKEKFIFKINGAQSEAIDLRFGQKTPIKGTFEVVDGHEFGIKQKDGSSYQYSYIKSGDVLRLGMGSIHEVKDFENFEIKPGRSGKIIRDAKGCRWVKGRRDDPIKVNCSIAKKDNHKVFKYQSPSHFRPEELAESELYVLGNLLVDGEMFDSIAVKQ